MELKAKKDVLEEITEAISAISQKRHADLHAISDHVLHAIIIYQDKEIVDLAVAIYSLDKILETEKYRAHKLMKPFVKKILELLRLAKKQLQQNNFSGYSMTLKGILASINSFGKSIRFYVDDLLHFARIKKGTKLYEHGLSFGRAAELAGVMKWELMPAIGETAVHEQIPAAKESVENKIMHVKKIFGVK